MLSRPLFTTSWILGRFCNYNCSYCWPYARSDKVDHLPIETYTGAVGSIVKQAGNNGFDQFHWSLSGGEPTAYKQLPQLIEHISLIPTVYNSLHMTTNLSPGSKWWKGWVDTTKNMSRRSLTVSHHDEFAKEQEFGDKCLFLQDQGVYVTINQVMVPEKFNNLYDKMVRFYDRGINVTLKPQSDPTASKIVDGYSDAQILIMQTGFPQRVLGEELYQIALVDAAGTEYLFDQAERFNAFGFNKFAGWTCNSGYQSVIIKGDEVKRSYSCHDVPLGTLSKGFELFNAPKVCSTASCVSSADSKIPKCLG